MTSIFERNVKEITQILNRSVVGLAGCGGIGSNAAVALCRAGVGHLILCDYDIVEPSNLNRQYFFQSDLGNPKTQALAFHLKNINPEIQLSIHHCRLTENNLFDIMGQADLLIEAFDCSIEKQWLIESWHDQFPDKPVICGNGLSGYDSLEDIHINNIDGIIFCGDGHTEMTMGLCAPKVAVVANLQAAVAVNELLQLKGNC